MVFVLISLILLCGCRGSTTESLAPFYWAAARGDVEQVRQLLGAGQNINDLSPTGKTALMYAAGALLDSSEHDYPGLAIKEDMAENIGMIDLLLHNGADINARAMGTGETALSLAVYHGRIATVRQLLASGANPNLGSLQMTPLEIAANRCYPDIASALITNGADLAQARDEAARHDCQEVIDVLPREN